MHKRKISRTLSCSVPLSYLIISFIYIPSFSSFFRVLLHLLMFVFLLSSHIFFSFLFSSSLSFCLFPSSYLCPFFLLLRLCPLTSTCSPQVATVFHESVFSNIRPLQLSDFTFTRNCFGHVKMRVVIILLSPTESLIMLLAIGRLDLLKIQLSGTLRRRRPAFYSR